LAGQILADRQRIHQEINDILKSTIVASDAAHVVYKGAKFGAATGKDLGMEGHGISAPNPNKPPGRWRVCV
jgi:hypothetical protein